jgi:hypothetical protein
VKLPRTVDTSMWRTRKVMFEWAVSICQCFKAMTLS